MAISRSIRLSSLATLSALLMPSMASAFSLFDDGSTTLNADISAIAGAFHSQRGYQQIASANGKRDWQEGFINYGVDAAHTFSQGQSTLYGKVTWTSSGTWGQGDAADFTDGSERDTGLEDLYIGWKSGNLFPFLGKDGVDISVGRQPVQVGDGFLIAGDSLNAGKGALNGSVNRGGSYYLAARSSFANTAVIRLGGSQGWRGDLMWLKSDNAIQAKPRLVVGTLEHVSDAGTLGVDYINVYKVNQHYAEELYPNRDHTQVYTLRAQGNAGVKDLFLAGQYAYERTGASSNKGQNAWYLEAGWTFSDVAWTPYVSYRFSRFSSSFDPLFYGNTRALGTWFQGEVAGNYAGPFNSNARIQQLRLDLSPLHNLTLGALLYRFDTIDKNSGVNNDGNELDIYANWAINDHWWVMPLIGRYDPSKVATNGGTQMKTGKANLYTQLLVGFNF